MTLQELGNILLHHKRLLWWMPREARDRMLMEIADDIVFEEQLRCVEKEMLECLIQ